MSYEPRLLAWRCCVRPGAARVGRCPRLALLTVIASLGACQAPGAVGPAPVATPVAAPLPGASGCGPSIARTQAVVDSDVATGNLNAPVGARFGTDLAGAAEACRAGREREALALLASAKARYGYR